MCLKNFFIYCLLWGDRIWSILVKILYALEKNVYFVVVEQRIL